ncbi:MAG: GNAT family N-acetyltransferase [Bacteroidota bacterium]
MGKRIQAFARFVSILIICFDGSNSNTKAASENHIFDFGLIQLKSLQFKVENREGNHLYTSNAWRSIGGKERLSANEVDSNTAISITYKVGTIKGLKALYTPSFQHRIGFFTSQIRNEKKVIRAFLEWLSNQSFPVVDISVSLHPDIFENVNTYSFDISAKYVYKLPLLGTEEELFKGLKSYTRSNLRKAQKELILIQKNDKSELIRLCDLTFDRQSTIYPRQELMDILESQLLQKSRLDFFAQRDGVNIAAVSILFDQERAFYLIGGYDKSNSHRGASTLAMWAALCAMKKKGIQEFDFQGSMIPGVERFIRGFGGEKVMYTSIQRYPWYIKLIKKLKRS